MKNIEIPKKIVGPPSGPALPFGPIFSGRVPKFKIYHQTFFLSRPPVSEKV